MFFGISEIKQTILKVRHCEENLFDKAIYMSVYISIDCFFLVPRHCNDG